MGLGREGRCEEALMGLFSSISSKNAAWLCGDYPGHIKLMSRCQQSRHSLMPWKEVGYELMLHSPAGLRSHLI